MRRVPIFRSKGHSLPSSSRLVPLTIAVVVCLVLISLAALALLTGFMLRPMAALVAIFCLLTAVVFHLNFADHVVSRR